VEQQRTPRGSGVVGTGAAARGVNVVAVSAAALPFRQPVIVTALPDGFLVGDPDSYEIREYSAIGALRRIIRRDVDLRLTAAMIVGYKEMQLAGRTGDARRAMETEIASREFPRTFPAFQRIEVDAARRIWVQDYSVTQDAPLTWTVFDPAGKMLGAITTPARFRILDFGGDYVLGRWRDDDNVAYIRLHSLTVPR
jgi:hypothetical protein